MKIKYLKRSLLFIGFSVVSCGSYESIVDTGIITQSLGSYSYIYKTRPCDIDFAFSEAGSEYCKSYEDHDSIRLKAINLLVAYGEALQGFVTETQFSSGDQLEIMLNSGRSAGFMNLTDAQIQGSSQIANATYTLINNGIKRKTLKTVIQGNNMAFQEIITAMKADLDLRKRFYATLISKTEDYMGLDPTVDADRREVLNDSEERVGYVKKNRLDNVSIKLLLNRLEQDRAQIDPLIQTLAAAGNAHNILAENYKKIGTGDDAALVKLIFNNLKSIYTGIESLKPIKE